MQCKANAFLSPVGPHLTLAFQSFGKMEPHSSGWNGVFGRQHGASAMIPNRGAVFHYNATRMRLFLLWSVMYDPLLLVNYRSKRIQFIVEVI